MSLPSLHIRYDFDLATSVKALQNKEIHFSCLAGNKDSLSEQILHDHFHFTLEDCRNMTQRIEKNGEAGALFPRVYMTMLPALLTNTNTKRDEMDKVWTDLVMNANEKYFKSDKLYIVFEHSDVLLRDRMIHSLGDFIKTQAEYIRFLKEIFIFFKIP